MTNQPMLIPDPPAKRSSLKAWIVASGEVGDEFLLEVVFAPNKAHARQTARRQWPDATEGGYEVDILRAKPFDHLAATGRQPTPREWLSVNQHVDCEHPDCPTGFRTDRDYTPEGEPPGPILCQDCADRLYPEAAAKRDADERIEWLAEQELARRRRERGEVPA